MGENTPKKPPRGVNCANWGSSAHRFRRETAVGPADPEEIASWGPPPPLLNFRAEIIAFHRIIWYNKKNTESFRRTQF